MVKLGYNAKVEVDFQRDQECWKDHIWKIHGSLIRKIVI